MVKYELDYSKFDDDLAVILPNGEVYSQIMKGI